MNVLRDHTKEVEKRVAAIHIRATDYCGFFMQRELALAPRRECWYCTYGDFQKDINDPHQAGFCKFKK